MAAVSSIISVHTTKARRGQSQDPVYYRPYTQCLHSVYLALGKSNINVLLYI